MGQCRTLDADVTIGCYYGDFTVHVTTLFLCPKQIFSPHHYYDAEKKILYGA